MKLDKKKKKELLQVYETYWAEYLNGNVEAMEVLLDDSYTQVGSAESEVFTSKKEAVQFLVDTIDQVAGKLEMRNRSTKLEQQDHLILIHELCDLYALADKKWVFYSKFRASTLLQEKKEGWKITHQHSSFPDTKTEAGQNVAIEKIAEENKELREAVKRRTVELEQKNRELQIEAALERVRARAMAMQKSEELADLSFELVKQVQALDVPTWFCAFNIYDNDPKGSTEWGSNGEGVFPNYRTPKEGIFLRYYKAGQRGESLLVNEIGEKKCPGHYEYLCSLPGVGEQLLKMKEAGIPFPTSQTDHVAFFKYGYILFITFEPAPESHEVFKRFAKVFEQTYTRFLDLQKAEAQTREAQIETALERVRSRSMAMHNSEELLDVITVVSEQLQELDFKFVHVSFANNDNSKEYKFWTAAKGLSKPMRFTTPYLDIAVFNNLRAAQENSVSFCTDVITKKEHNKWHTHLLKHGGSKVFSKEDNELIMSRGMARSTAINPNIMLILANYASIPYSEDENKIIERFGQVFEQSYTRFLDLQKAEAQTRDAQIEAAMERIRSRAIAMRTSNELLEVALEIRIQTDLLGQQDLELSVVHLYEKDAEYFESLAAMRTPGSEGKITTHKMKFPVDATPEIQQMMKNYWAGLSQYTIELNLKQREVWQKVLETTVPDLFDQRLQFNEDEIVADKKEYWNFTDFSGGSLLTVTYSPPTMETKELFRRAADVFDLAYKRFKDLKNAEKQAREAQIEAALERVRSRSMAMHKSEELKDVIQVVYDQFVNLNIHTEHTGFIIDYKENDDMHIWLADKNEVATEVIIPYFDCAHWNSFNDAKKNGKNFFANHLTFEEKNKFYKDLFKQTPDLPKSLLEIYLNYPGLAISTVLLENVALYIENFDGIPYSDEENDTLMRFGKVFQQTYTRFLDLQKAETQAREAQIEMALERVRTASMTMQKGNELANVISVVFKQLKILGIDSEGCVLNLYDENDGMAMWMSGFGEELHPKSFHISYFDHPYYQAQLEAWKEQQNYMELAFEGKLKRSMDDQTFANKDFFDLPKDIKEAFLSKEKVISSMAFMKYGMLEMIGDETLSDDQASILCRFSKVFEQAYQRFLDIEKADAQAREAQIEAALEKVRSHSLAMHKPDELVEVVKVIVGKLKELGVVLDANGVVLCTYFNNSKDVMHWIVSPDFSLAGSYLLPYFNHPIFNDTWESKMSGTPYFSKAFSIKEKNSFWEYAFEHTDYKNFPEDFKEWVFKNNKHTLSFAWQKNSAILIPSHTGIVPNESEKEILIRFAKVFEQAYIRFLDLQKAEAQAREAIKQASLDRVRGQIASMRSTADLERITPLVWNELTTMGVPFIRCGVFIIEENTKIVKAYLSTPEGASLGVLNLPFDVNILTAQSIDYWYKKEVYHQHWNKEEFIAWSQSLMEQGYIRDTTKYQGASQPPESLDLHFIPFTQGMLYVGSENPLNVEQIELVQSLADAFAIAYARYEDFTKLEKAKESVETTLTELKATQNQLVQSEKMASLGELTAGIAHEIQNPLNFVNNFSEVSKELLEEMMEEMQKGDVEEVKALADDIIQNLEKIHHHGKRADGIVKGMLQHSRTSSGEKEPTDINALADEYLRLAYHGLRAKDKSFNATLETHFDETIGKVNVIPQDIGRVVLNLITNAFYATNEKKNHDQTGYEPTVTVTTKKEADKVFVLVKDNGNGIPKKVLDKIFQPFFTTKPTGQGTGLGLSLSYDIVKAHGGELNVNTKKNDGTEFIIIIPRN